MSVQRDALRAKLLATRAPAQKEITFFGETVEIRQPTLADVLKAQEADTVQSGIVQMIINYAFVPGTQEKVFEPADGDQLLTLPFGQEFIDLSKALESLTQVNFLDKKPSSEETP